MTNKEKLVRAFYKAKTPGSPWCYLSKVKIAGGFTDKQMENLVRQIKAGDRYALGRAIYFEADISRYKKYAGVNFMTVVIL